MKQVSLHNIVLPEEQLALNKIPSKPKSVVFTNRYLYTSKQQRMRSGTSKNLSSIIGMEGFLNSESTIIPPSLTGSFPVRKSNTNPHKILYKYRHPKGPTYSREPSFHFKV